MIGRVQLGVERALRRATDGLVAVSPEEARALGAAARARITRDFDVGAMVDALHAIYEEHA